MLGVYIILYPNTALNYKRFFTYLFRFNRQYVKKAGFRVRILRKSEKNINAAGRIVCPYNMGTKVLFVNRVFF
ncbi:MAG: hypothetical protein LBL00_07420 [Endomicrobium sp.]|nr:hypothetical protein [Endomicrobium sp.]